MERQDTPESPQIVEPLVVNVIPNPDVIKAVRAVRDWNPFEIMRHLYMSGINSGIATDWDEGTTVYIEHPTLSQTHFGKNDFDRMAEWMDYEARRLFPMSAYAVGRQSSEAAVDGQEEKR
jgi:hypothetical protein